MLGFFLSRSLKAATRGDDIFGLFAVVILLIVTAWGNAIAMMIVAGVGFVGLLLLKGRAFRGALLVALVAFAVAAAVAGYLLSS